MHALISCEKVQSLVDLIQRKVCKIEFLKMAAATGSGPGPGKATEASSKPSGAAREATTGDSSFKKFMNEVGFSIKWKISRHNECSWQLAIQIVMVYEKYG